MKPVDFHTIVVGAGFAGLSTAYHLARQGVGVVGILEKDKAAALHASGKNAGMIRQTIADPVLARLGREGRVALERFGHGQKFFSTGHGSLLLSRKNQERELKKIAACARKAGVKTRWLSHAEAAKRVGLLRDARFGRALFCPSDRSIDIRVLRESFLSALRREKVPLITRSPIESIQKKGGYFYVRAGGKIFRTKHFVNAAGAWAGEVGKKAHALGIPLKAYRRHLYVSKSWKKTDVRWPFVWDLSAEFYFRPLEEKALLLSPCDKTLTSFEKSAGEKTDPRMKKSLLRKMKKFSAGFGGLKLVREKAALRTMAPDGRFVVGEDPKLSGFFWVAGLGGHGVTTCFSVGHLAADLILGKKTDPVLTKALSPRRFLKNK